MSTIHQLIRPSLRVARIVYFTDLTRADSRVIALGAFSEIVHKDVHGLALKARSGLGAAELDLINPLLRDRLADPFVFMRGEFQNAWEQAKPGEALTFLAGRHSSSLSILRPRPVSEEAWWWRKLVSSRSIETKLGEAVDNEFSELMKENADRKTVRERTVIEVDRAA